MNFRSLIYWSIVFHSLYIVLSLFGIFNEIIVTKSCEGKTKTYILIQNKTISQPEIDYFKFIETTSFILYISLIIISIYSLIAMRNDLDSDFLSKFLIIKSGIFLVLFIVVFVTGNISGYYCGHKLVIAYINWIIWLIAEINAVFLIININFHKHGIEENEKV